MKRVIILILFVNSIFFLSRPVSAQEEWNTYETSCCIIRFQNDDLLMKFTLRIGGFRFTSKGLDDNPSNVKFRIEEIMEKVKSTLDMYPSEMRLSFQLYPDYESLENVFRQFTSSGNVPIAFYAHKTRFIYVNVDSVTDGVIAHEIAHAVINAYFKVPPPAKMQEILAQYVDLHLWD